MVTRATAQFAYVLHQWDWSETSLILDLFTREHGRVAAVAKGAKRPYSQLRPVLMPFQRLLVATGRPKTEEGADILTLRSAEFAGAGAPLPAARLFSGFYLNELLMKALARGDPHERLFDAYGDTLAALARADDEAALRAFELVLLRETGVLPDLACTTTTQQPVQPAAGYLLQAEAGLVSAGGAHAAAERGGGFGGALVSPSSGQSSGQPSGQLSGTQCLALQAALDQHDGAALRSACADALPQLKSQLRAVLHYHLGSPPLRTRQLMLDLRRLLDSPSSRTANLTAPTGPP
jgi:DNA repair protein RecO (recombination protein O)